MAKSMISSERGKLGDPPSPPDDFGYLFVNNNRTVTIVKNVLLVQASNLVHDTSSEHSESQEVVRSSDYQARNIPQQGKIKKSLEQRNQTHQPCLRENQGTVLLRRVERLNTNMHEACLKIDKECRVLTVHGSDDAVITWKVPRSLPRSYQTTSWRFWRGADHCYTKHQSQLVATVTEFIKTVLIVMPKNMRSSQNKEDVNIDWTK
ncbi:hypothetical protein Bca52824_031622 [Brassica carinata]|uniref:Uncharacterized protein n=1 Tax=Brassica carinata TaxID=52824 RepID=A0A8X7V6T7_BRACI|nr:hypothetical protein Bca52824_031622 [Brassica carinata]